MNRHHDASGPQRRIANTLEMRNLGTHSAVRLIDATLSAVDRRDVVWEHRFPTPEPAIRLFLVMLPHPDRWAAWSRMISILGADFLYGLVAAEAEEARIVERRRLRERKRIEELKGRRTESTGRTRLWMVLYGSRPEIVASRGHQRAVLLRLETVDEALRVWDWLRWQQHLIGEWLRMLDLEGVGPVETRILGGMFRQERRFKEQHTVYDPGRPLREWRPGIGSGDAYDR